MNVIIQNRNATMNVKTFNHCTSLLRQPFDSSGDQHTCHRATGAFSDHGNGAWIEWCFQVVIN